MANELTSTASAQGAPSPEQTAPASQPAPRPTPEGNAQPTQPMPAETSQPRSDNWQDDPKFKEYQRSYNKALETERRERQRLEQQAQARIKALEQQLEQFATRDLSSEELTEREQLKLRQALEEKDQQYRELYQTYAKDLAKSEIARRAGITVDLLADVESPDDAWELALQTRVAEERAKMEAQYKDKLASAPGNSPDLGSGKPTAAVSSTDGFKFKSNSDLRDTYRRLWDEYNG